MPPRPWTGLALGTLTLALVAGCLSAFAPPLRTRGRPHHEALRPDSSTKTCMGCHRSEAEALAAQQRAALGPKHGHALDHGEGHDHDHGASSDHAHEHDAPKPDDAPLVADWMLADERSCLGCHRLAGATDAR
ncbi:hypothetical protein PPSIR1_09410 [Plesiocystis pacifica SIR-1]|uniref:Uncharacterized protein n=1 Tax=Plesiocystis pacifica SIR-1 TaxID=391625 RepID=A6GJV7_9BACT|nr:hypothetical protein [Plesiocystis pacifica]EDM73855.1 hypothetical protein PPSIR1_09410 [Plesiocystis pacifica SIR-1]